MLSFILKKTTDAEFSCVLVSSDFCSADRSSSSLMFNKTWKRNTYVCYSVVFLRALNARMFHQICSFRNDFETAQMCWIKMDHTQFTGHENLMVWNRVGRTVISTARWTANLRGNFSIILLRAIIKFALFTATKWQCVCESMCVRESMCMCECSASTAFVRQTNLDSKTELAYNATVLANSSSELPQNTRELPHNTMELTNNITAYFQLNSILSSMKNGVSPHHAVRKQLLIVSNYSVGHEICSLLYNGIFFFNSYFNILYLDK